MNKEVKEFLSNYRPEVRDLALDLHRIIREVAPDSEFKVYTGWKNICYSFGGGMKNTFCAVAPHTAHVNLQFAAGADLADPAQLLSGSGKKIRHAKITGAEDARAEALKTLIAEAAERSRPKLR